MAKNMNVGNAELTIKVTLDRESLREAIEEIKRELEAIELKVRVELSQP